MLSAANNEKLTRVGPGTPMGEVMRRYWMPALMSSELPEPDGAPVRVRLLGEDLIAFRDSDGRIGLLSEWCPHRRASLYLGRVEEGGIACVYHGWKFDVAGACLAMPNEPPASSFKDRVRQVSYPVEERAGIIWAYLGPAGRKPPMVNHEWTRMGERQLEVSKTYEECNYAQGLEGGMDTAHVGFLHRDFTARTHLGPNSPWVRAPHPKLEVLQTDYGFTYAGLRDLGEDGTFVRLYHFVMPFYQIRSHEGYLTDRPVIQGHMWVPIDDTHTWVWNWTYEKDLSELTREEIELEEQQTGRAPEHLADGFRLVRNAGNDYLLDRELQRTGNFSGIEGVNTQDIALQESMGPILDRSQEHLGTTDIAVIATRRLLLQAADDVADGQDPLGHDGGTSDSVRAAEMTIPPGRYWYDELREEATAIG
jgi:phthalate 4,5-dioxygenase oxygenase subunit